MKKYRMGNQPEEYELREDYLGWTPEGDDWQSLCLRFTRDTKLTIVNPQGGEKVLFLHQFIIKDAFPMSFFGEERSKDWWTFAIVSEDETSEKFIIPLH